MSFVFATIAFKHELLKNHIDSIQKKYASKIEFIVVTASEIWSREILQNEPKLTVVNAQPKGIYSAYNTGWKEALGDYICFTSPENFVDINGILEFLSEINEENLPVLYGDTKVVDDTDGSEWIIFGSPHSNTLNEMRMPSGHQAQLIPRIELAKLSGYSQKINVFGVGFKLKYAADYEFYARSLTSGTRWAHSQDINAKQELGGASSQHWLRTTAEINLISWVYGSKTIRQAWKIMRTFVGAARFHIPRQRRRRRQ